MYFDKVNFFALHSLCIFLTFEITFISAMHAKLSVNFLKLSPPSEFQLTLCVNFLKCNFNKALQCETFESASDNTDFTTRNECRSSFNTMSGCFFSMEQKFH